ncbi:MAG: hypothetical protein F4Z15_08275 [Gammaproteobacteria bacterium]|nr:hypothetical protein [Gammaproteobacteria bacterium]MYD77101.1 hypothetical protein [Gammaproteobacteria bacterium]MYJ51467.1 hypothetical protein [Gammaproteobacteria bacterium]
MKKVLEKTLSGLIFLVFWNAIAIAETTSAEVGGTNISIVPPQAWCMIDPSKLSDARLIGILRDGFRQSGSTFVIAYAECGELERWRTATQKTLNNYAILAFDDGLREFVYPGTDASFASELRQILENQGQEYLVARLEREKEVVEDVIPDTMELGKPTILGIVGEDGFSVYLGGKIPMKTEFGDLKITTFTTGTTLLNRKVVSTYLYTDNDNDPVYSGLLGKHKSWTARLRAAN